MQRVTTSARYLHAHAGRHHPRPHAQGPYDGGAGVVRGGTKYTSQAVSARNQAAVRVWKVDSTQLPLANECLYYTCFVPMCDIRLPG